MKQLPSRLEYYPGGTLNLLTDKINELRDYLSDKEKGQVSLRRGIDKSRKSDKEVSKGECPHCDGKHMDGYTHSPKTCSICKVVSNPPQQEESRGGCDKCGGLPFKHKEWCGKPQLKEESPKEDEVEKLFKIIEKHGEGTSEGYIYWESWADEPQSLKQELAGYINSRYVSKEKIKEIRLDERKKLLKEIYDAGKMEDGYYNPGKSYRCFDALFRNSLSDNPSLGLEEL